MTNAHTVLTRVLVLAAVAGLIMPIATGAQPPTPDLLSVYVGMPQNAARATLQKRMPGSTLSNGAEGFTLSVNDPNNRDMVRVYRGAKRACGLAGPADTEFQPDESDDEVSAPVRPA